MRGTPGQDFLPSENLSLPGGVAERRDRGGRGSRVEGCRWIVGLGGVTRTGVAGAAGQPFVSLAVAAGSDWRPGAAPTPVFPWLPAG